MPRRFSAPRGNGEVLADPGFDEVPALVEANRRLLNRAEVRIDGISLSELRKQVREPFVLGDVPFIVGGHQPELTHPGVWAKNFALCGITRKVGGSSLHLIVDNDTFKSASIKVPVFKTGDPQSVVLESVPFDKLDITPTFEEYNVHDRDLFASLPERLRKLTENWPFEPTALKAWPKLSDPFIDSHQFTDLRLRFERQWGCVNYEFQVSRISGFESFRRFAKHIVDDLPAFQESYNGAIREYRKVNRVRSRTHPAPELQPFEAPFWTLTESGRRPLFIKPGETLPEQIRPRALTLTLFARLILGDFFIHGIGGGKYDEVTDAIIRNYFGIEPPAYQVVSATLHLPLPGFPSTESDLDAARRRVRDLQWNPQRNVLPPASEDRLVLRLVADREDLAASEPPLKDHVSRREWYRKLAELNEQLRHHVWKQVPPAKANLARVEAEVQANAVLRRRDYSWVLFPEETLRPFLQRFLKV